jgi:proteasome lid subunit RPN8/RPN11
MEENKEETKDVNSNKNSSDKQLRNKSARTSHSHVSDNAIKDSLKGPNSDLEVLKNRSKYKGKNKYHKEPLNSRRSASRVHSLSYETPARSKYDDKSKFIDTLRSSLGVIKNKHSPEIIHEITHDDDEDYFGPLEVKHKLNKSFANSDIHEFLDLKIPFEDPNLDLRRSKRKHARHSFADFNENGITIDDNQDDDEYRLIKCNQFDGGIKNQPILVFLSFQSLLYMNIHAHLFLNEVIGFNAGHAFKHKSGKQAIYIHDVYPVDPIEDTLADRSKSVEMDPESSELTRKLAESRGQTICGWYHSHPIFDTNPSRIDICNQHMYQTIFDNHDNKPFVGFIVGPYSPKLNSYKVISEFKCFNVADENGDTSPYELTVNIVPQK